jgi:hypothetical protein
MHFYQIRHCAHLCGDEAYISGEQLKDKRGYWLAASKKKKKRPALTEGSLGQE